MDVPEYRSQAVSPGENRVTKKPFLNGLQFSRAYFLLLLSGLDEFYQLNGCYDPMNKNNRFYRRSLDGCGQVRPPDKTESLVYQNTIRRFNTAVASLPSTEQNLFYLRYYQEFSLNELANVYGLTAQAIRMRLQHINYKMERCCIHQLAF